MRAAHPSVSSVLASAAARRPTAGRAITRRPPWSSLRAPSDGQRQRQGGRGRRSVLPFVQPAEQVAGRLLDLLMVVLRCTLSGVDEGGPVDLLEVPIGEAVAVLSLLRRLGV